MNNCTRHNAGVLTNDASLVGNYLTVISSDIDRPETEQLDLGSRACLNVKGRKINALSIGNFIVSLLHGATDCTGVGRIPSQGKGSGTSIVDAKAGMTFLG